MSDLDGTRQIVAAQLMGLDASSFDVGVLLDGRMVLRTGAVRDILKQVPWLRARNAWGAHIFVRPVGTEVVLVDDLTYDAVGRLYRDHIIPAAAVETSPGNYQAWVRVAAAPLARPLATAVARVLCDTYGGDPNAAHVRQFGRLAGFENRKTAHRRRGAYPLVLLRATHRGVTPNAAAPLKRAERRLVEDQHRQEIGHRQMPATLQRRVALDLPVATAREDDALSPLGELYQLEAERLLRRYPDADVSKLDWMILQSMVQAFKTVSAEELARAMIDGSPRLVERKRGHVHDYVRRTVRKVLEQRGGGRGGDATET